MGRLTEGLIWASAGAGLTYLLTRRSLEIEFQKRLDAQIKSADDFYRRKYERDLKAERKRDLGETKETLETLVEESPVSDKSVDWDEVQRTMSEPEEEKESESIIAEAGLTSTLTNYSGMFKGETAPSEHIVVERRPTVEVEETPEEPSLPSKNPDKLPVLISEEAYYDNHSGFKQASRIYFAGDDVLATEMNEKVPETVRRLELGDKILESLKMGLDGNTATLHVRNEKTGTEYEVFREPDSYVDFVPSAE